MGEKKKRIYHALVDGASAGLSDSALFAYVRDKCPNTSSKGLVRASLLALGDPDLKDRNVLSTIYALAIKHRLDERGAVAGQPDEDPAAAPTIAEQADAATGAKGKRRRPATPAAATGPA